jgi:arginyl-tRNA synthetase
MSSPTPAHPLDDLRAAVSAAASTLADEPPRSQPSLERPKKAAFGDLSTNAAMLLAPVMKAPPRDVAGRLGEALSGTLGDRLERVEVAGPGFLNLFLGDAWFVDALRGVLDGGDAFGGGGAQPALKIDDEFVSANPTGPLHIGHARNAAYGDAIARILAFHGHEVTREYYVNDYGSQIVRLAESIRARARGEEVPEDGYQGEYVEDLVGLDDGEISLDELGQLAVAALRERIGQTLEAFRVAPFDVWFSERSLHPDKVEHALDVLREQGNTYEADGALWLRTTAFGDDKDRVLVRSSGEHTYFTSDIGYMQDKRERGFDQFLYILGADHHGYIGRMRAAFQALGGDPDQLDLLIMQFVNLPEGKMSKRAGTIVTVEDLVDDIGVDATRWFLLARSHDTTIELDLDLARRESSDNPVYYVQYAHARIAGVLAKAGVDEASVAFAERSQPLEPGERALIMKLLAFPAEVADAAERRAPHRIAAYALELAQEFTAFYRDCRVVGSEVEDFRLALCVAAKRTIARALGLLGVSAPDSM